MKRNFIRYRVGWVLVVLNWALLSSIVAAQAVAGANTPPTANPSASTGHAAWGEFVSLFGNFTDPDVGDTHTYSWVQIKTSGEPTVAPLNPDQRNTSIVTPNVDVTLRYLFAVTDSADGSDAAAIEILVTEEGDEVIEGTPFGCESVENQPAVATVPAVYTVTEGIRGEIQATNAADPDNTPGECSPLGCVGFEWSVTNGLARIDHRFGNEGDFGRPERFSESFSIDPVQVE